MAVVLLVSGNVIVDDIDLSVLRKKEHSMNNLEVGYFTEQDDSGGGGG